MAPCEQTRPKVPTQFPSAQNLSSLVSFSPLPKRHLYEHSPIPNSYFTMKTKLASLLALVVLSAATLTAGEAPQPKPASPEFTKLKTLVGTWTGKTDMGQGPVDITIEYRLIAAGSVLEERCMVGTPNEMVTMYYDQGGKLALTHYCMLGNRPAMTLASSEGDTLKFNFDACCAIDTTKEAHMHAMTLHFDDANQITSTCQAMFGGKEVPEHAMVLHRVAKPALSQN